MSASASEAQARKPPIRVDVCIVSYRTAEFVINCLRSLMVERGAARSSGIEMRVLVVDNDSGDAAVLERFVVSEGIGDFVKVIRAERNGGFAYGNNLAFRYAYDSGLVPDYFWLLNPDTEVCPRGLIELVEFMAPRPQVGIAGSALIEATGQVWPYAFRFPSPVSEALSGLSLQILDRLLPEQVLTKKMGSEPEEVDWLPGASMLLRRSVLERIGGLDESYFLYYEETDYCLRVKEAGYSTYYAPRSRVRHFPGGSTGVTTTRETPRRLPGYWYESRRRYFHNNFGLPLAIATDFVLVGAAGLGAIKRVLKGEGNQNIPHHVRDLVAHSLLWKKNRALAPAKSYRPSRTD